VTGDDDPAELDYCYVTTTGRRSGNPHTIEIWFAVNDRRVYLLAGDGDQSDWVRNIRQEPRVALRLGGDDMICRARVVEDADEEALARGLLLDKYAPRSSGDLDEWGRTALPVVIDLPSAAASPA
jgi:deazaflavin-dependent oxidoreductase (nitroreductase family)